MRKVHVLAVVSLLVVAVRHKARPLLDSHETAGSGALAPSDVPREPAPEVLAPAAASTLEREVKLSAPIGFDLPVGKQVAGLTAGARTRVELDATYFDVADFRLARLGCTLRHRSDSGWTLKLPSSGTPGRGLSRHEIGLAGEPGEPPPQALSLLRAHLRGNPLVPVAGLITVREQVVLRDASGVPQAEIVDDRVTVERAGVAVGTFRELEVELSASAPKTLLKKLEAALLAAGATASPQVPKLVQALGAAAAAPPEVFARRLGTKPSAGEVVQAAIARSVARYLMHDPGLVTGIDPEDVHQARVALRRLRSDLKTFSPLLDPSWSEGIAAEATWLATHLGAVRDAEVLRERLEVAAAELPESDREGIVGLLAHLDVARDEARRALLMARDSDRFVTTMGLFVAAAQAPALTTASTSPAKRTIPMLIRRPVRKAIATAKGLPQRPSDAQLHDLRKRAKRVRYAADVAGGVSGNRARARALAASAARLQSVLGDHQDAAVMRAWLAATARDATPMAAFVAGQLHANQLDALNAGRRGWRSAWKALAAAASPFR